MSDSDLVALALKSREFAHAPYSGFKVGAALKTVSGEIVGGCNVENVSYGLTMCAERVALGSAVAAGFSRFQSIAIVSDSEEPVVPCGACRQVLAEFNPQLKVVSSTVSGKVSEFDLSVLFPRPRQGILG